jgi:hypothetical protein
MEEGIDGAQADLTVETLVRNFSTLESYSTLDIGDDIRYSLAPDFRSGTNQKLRPRSGKFQNLRLKENGSGLEKKYDGEASKSKNNMRHSSSATDTRLRKEAVQRSFHTGQETFTVLSNSSPGRSKTKVIAKSSWNTNEATNLAPTTLSKNPPRGVKLSGLNAAGPSNTKRVVEERPKQNGLNSSY